MDATGFNRDEIEPDMDLRRDLSIRSSRLPIIMDAAERHFGITIELEDFIDVRTVRDIARKISEIVAREGGAGAQPETGALASTPSIPSTSSTLGQPSAATGGAVDGEDLLENLIRIIMDATGFEREEIEPDMDLRKDLSIRSSRLPIIMDAAERQFGITIELEDFIGTRTVREIAQKISEIIARQGGATLQPDTGAVAPDPVHDETVKTPEDGQA